MNIAENRPIPVPQFLKFNWPKFLGQITGPIIDGAMVLSLNPNPIEGEHVIVSQGFATPTPEECKRIIESAAVENIAKEFFTLEKTKYLITTVTERYLYGRSVVPNQPGGILLYKTQRFFVVVRHLGSTRGSDVIAHVDRYIDEILPL